MASDPKVPEVMEWQAGQGEGDEGGDELCRSSARSVVTTVTHRTRSHSTDRTP